MFFSFNMLSRTFSVIRQGNSWSKLSRKCASQATSSRLTGFQERLATGPQLQDFLRNPGTTLLTDDEKSNLLSSLSDQIKEDTYVAKRAKKGSPSAHPYLDPNLLHGQGRKVYFETYGCQMNVNDTEIASRILLNSGYVLTDKDEEADIIFLMTCSIRENAEDKIWSRLRKLRNKKGRQVGILGCMAERLKTKILEQDKLVDIIAGPDAYKDLPQLLAINHLTGINAVNVLLSLDETYADVLPSVTPSSPLTQSHSSFISIMRGCDNLCTYCIVPLTRGRERSRPIHSIIKEVQLLVTEKEIKEITLLGQNVNSYRDLTGSDKLEEQDKLTSSLVPGFKTVYKERRGGLTFATLLDQVAQVNPEVRIRFTSPHPKDFPDSVLQVISKHKNICKSIHLPAQSGSNSVLQRMKRGYTREAYFDLVHHIRSLIPGVSLSTDIICGFCGETEADHEDTLDLMERVKYNYAYVFAYSMRDRTQAFHKLTDDVKHEDKIRRVIQVNEVFRRNSLKINQSMIGSKQLLLVEGVSKRSKDHLVGRTDGNTKLVFPKKAVIDDVSSEMRVPAPGEYLAAQVTDTTNQTLKGLPLYLTSLSRFYKKD